MQKKDWVSHIESILSQGYSFVYKIQDENKAPLLFACDVFRRRRHDVIIDIAPSETGRAVLSVCISAAVTALEFTVRRDQTVANIIQSMTQPNIHVVTIRGCGTVLNIVCRVVEIALHTGWFVEKNVLNTLTQTGTDNIKQRNTTLLVVLRRGSNMRSI
tara:strand:- start:2360 stop:2836 length:477 start_codon:yes stop_codon:yes gene_type:complete